MDETIPHDPRTLTLADGRTLGWAEYGAPDGRPVVYCHGFPGSRLEWGMIDPLSRAAAHGLRVIAPDRPGTGSSSSQPPRTLLDWPADVGALLQELGIDRFALLGVSGGGPYAEACAFRFGERVTSVAIVSGMGPATAPGVRDGLAWSIPGKPRLLRLGMLKLFVLGLKEPDRLLEGSRKSMAEPDRPMLDDPAFAAAFIAGLAEALRPGVRGAADEAAIYRADWGFDLRDLKTPVSLWHGGRDGNVPVSVGRWVADQITDCEAVFLEAEGHLSLLPKILEDVLARLAS